MFPFIPSSLLLVLLLAAPALLTPSTSHELQVRGQRTPRDAKQDSVKVVISESFLTQGDSSDVSQGGREINLIPGSPLVLTHKIKLVPSGSGSGSCGCEADFAALRERLERLEREVSSLREKCGGAEGGCCTSKESKGAGCSIKPKTDECPNECSDQGRCVDGKCVCFPGFSGPDCSESNCPGNCNDNGRCVNGQCVCDPGFAGVDCSQRGCPDNCNDHGRCVNGKCVCDSGFAGPSCSDKSCPGNCNNRGRCVNGQCVCNPGFTGTDCSEKSCPGNCNNKGRCVNGQCACNPGFTGPDCSKRACPDNCNNRGRCVNGKCVCDSSFTGADCSEDSCPGNCNNKGRCVDGECVCDDGFGGPDCSERTCPDDCSDRGRCVNGKCVCDSGFTGDDCSEASCPGNCNNKGRCVNGRCVCDSGFTGDDCSEASCPGNCNNKGRCLNGRCVCDAGFTGDDCSEASCPGNCNNKGRCLNGRCVCDAGFTGDDCSEKACPKNCSNHGKCANGKCVCEVGFAGPDCSAKRCPGNCNNKGRCVKGKCVCRRGFTGPDCSQCEEGRTGANCDTVMSGVTRLSTRDITETSVTLLWTQPRVQYDTYYITFTSQKESDQQISVQVEGSLTSFTQTGLAAGQDYTVSITGEIDGRKGAETSAEFMTLISGPANLRVVKTTSTSAVVQWEQSQGEIDRYRLTVTPSDGAGRSQEMTVPAGQDSAELRQLEAGRLYDITLVAEKGTSQSKPATTQVTPGTTSPRVTTAALTLAPGRDVGDRHQDFNPSAEVQVFDQQDGSEAVKVGGIDGPNKVSTTSVTARTKPLVSRKMAINGTKPKDSERPALYRKPNASGPFRFNTTRVVPGRRKFGPGPLKKPPVGQKKKAPIVPKKTKPGVPAIGDGTLTVRDPSVEASSTERRDNKNPAIMSGTDSDANRLSSSEEPTVAVGSKEQPDVGTAGQGNDTAPVSAEPTGTAQSQEKKCMNKVKVTHIRLPHRGRGGGCRGDGTVLVGKTPGSDRGSSETDDLKPSSAATDLDYSPDPLRKLLMDTFDSLNITTFSVHLSEPSTLSVNAETTRKQILSGLKPLSPSSSWSLPSSTSQSSSRTSSSLASPSLVPSFSTAAPSSSLTLLGSSPSSLPSPPSSLPSISPSPPSVSLSSSDKSGSVGRNELDVDTSESGTDVTSPQDQKLPPSGKGGIPLFQRRPAKRGYVSRLRPNLGLSQNKTRLNLRVPHGSTPRFSLIPRREPETRHTSTSELSFSPSTSASEEPSSVEINAPVRDSSGLKPLLPSSSWSSSSSTSQSSSQSSSSLASLSLASSSSSAAPSPSHSSAEPSSSSLPSSPSSLASPSLAPSSSIADPSSSLTSLVSSPSSSPSLPSSLPLLSPSPSSASLSSSNKSGSVGSNELDVDNSKSATDVTSPQDQKLPPPGKAGVPLFHRTPAKHGYVRHLRPNSGQFQNKTRLNLRVPHGSTPRLNLIPRREPETRHTSTSELSFIPSPSVSEEPSSVEVTAPLKDSSGDQEGATTPASTGVEQNQKKVPTERGRIPVRRLPPKGGYLRRPNFRPLQNRTRPNLRLLPPPSRPLNPASDTRKEQASSTELPATSSSKESYLAEGTGPKGEEDEDKVGTKMSSTSMSTEFNQTFRESEVPSSHRPSTRFGYYRRPQLYDGRFPNKTRTNLRPPQHPMRKPFPARKLNEGITFGGQVRQSEKDSTPEIPDNPSGGQDVPMPTQGVQNRQSGEQDTAKVISSSQMDGHDATVRPQINEVEGGAPVQTTKTGEEEETSTPDSNSHKERDNAGKATSQGRPTIKQASSDSRPGAPRPVTPPKRKPPTRTMTAPHPTQTRRYNSGGKMREDKTNSTAKRLFDSKPKQSIKSADSKPRTGSDVPSSGVTREPLDHVGVTNQTSDGFTLIWDSPEEKYKNFVVTSKDVEKDEGPKRKESKKDQVEKQEDSGDEEEEVKHQPSKGTENGGSEDENRVPESVSTQSPLIQRSTKTKPVTGSDKTFKKVLPGSARSFQFENLPPQTEYTVTLLGKGPGLLSRLHKLVISTGPEPPTDIVFSELTENSLTVSWTKPKTSISGFKVTYTHAEEGEPVSVSVDSDDSTVDLSQLSPGSSYEVSVLSVLGLDESDPIKDFVMTLPDPPTHLRTLNVTDTKALLLWRPALAAVDKYAIVYGSGTDSELRVTVSGNAAEQQLSDLEGSTTYTVTITSQLGGVESSAASTSFTTAGGSGSGGDGPSDLQANNVSPRTALLSWKPNANPASSYRLTYQTEGQEMKEVIVDASLTEYNLTRLHPGSEYTVQLQAEGGGRYTDAISTDFTTGTLRFPFPTDCSQELLNGIRTSGEVEIFPQGKLGTPIMVSCDMETDGGGWTVFQRRKDGSVNFFRGWKDYTKGFGSVSGEFWLGLESLYNLTAMTKMTLRVDLRDKDEAVYAKYSTFELLKRNYKLNVGGYSGTAGDSLSYHSQRIFSTKDRDLSPFITRCAMSYRGGWWYKNCHEANLNGLYGTNVNHQGVIWTAWKGKQFSIPFTEMKMRPAAFSPPTAG
ncbi:tenascin-like [Sebastes umbrosus]|uniref:tenascin-like n=1 Tax=Sebastes umbrosus TaxID=72105 RepID=UPI00189EFCE7|nr:tenascin-like [Sebastes umbrosus]